MDSQSLIEQLLALPDAKSQTRFLKQHAAQWDDQLAQALKDRADKFLRADIQRSLQCSDLLLRLAALSGKPHHRALGLLAEANARSLGGLGEYQRALELYDEAADIYQAQTRGVDQAKSQVGKILALANLGRYAEALETGEWASAILQKHAQWRPLATLTMNLAIVHGRLGEDTQALILFERAREIYNLLGAEGEPHLPWVEQNKAIVLRNLGQFEAAIQASQTAYEILTRLGQKVAAARARQNIAITYFALGRYNEALALLDEVRDTFLADGRARDAMLVELFISDCMLQLRRFADVLNKCSKVRSLFTEMGTRFEVGQAILNEAIAFTGLHQYSEALASLAEARHLFVAEGNHVWIACTDLEISAVLLYQGEYEKSLATAQTCAQVFLDYGRTVKKAQAQLIAARAALALAQPEEAYHFVHEALAIGEGQDIPSIKHQSYQLRGDLAVASGERQAALAEYDRAILELERLRGRLMIEFRSDFLEDKQAIYEDAVRLCLDLDQPARGLEYTERAKSRTLLDLLAYRLDLGIRTRQAADGPIVEELNRLRAERDRLYRRWESEEDFQQRGRFSSNGDRQQVQQEVLALEQRITDLWHKLLIHNADYAREADLWQVRAEPIQPHLEPEVVLLEYFIARRELIVFLVSSETVRAMRLPGDLGQVQNLMKRLWLNLKAVPKSAPGRAISLEKNARGLLQQLHAHLVAPLSNHLVQPQRLVIVPHGPLHYLPFHALYDGQSYLLEKHEISYLPGASLLRYLKPTPPALSQGEREVAVVFGHSYAGRLPHTVLEAQSVASCLDGQAFLEEKATLARLREVAPTCQTLHLATHGDFRADNPLFSGLALADGWLTTLEIFNLHLAASLVTLSACQTGRNVVGGGDELLGLMRAFLHAGAASLVLSLWPVEDRSAAHLMDAFYQKLGQGWSKGTTLRHAQLMFLHEDDYVHPYFWAPFFLVGDIGLGHGWQRGRARLPGAAGQRRVSAARLAAGLDRGPGEHRPFPGRQPRDLGRTSPRLGPRGDRCHLLG